MKKNPALLTRRAVLASAALGGAALLGRPVLLLAKDTAGLDELEKSLRGELVTPEDDHYDVVRQVWNGMVDKRPAAIARCTGVADVVEVVKFARANDLEVSVRGGGHNVAGKALKDHAITIDLGAMNNVRVDPDTKTARAGGGARWAAFDRETLAFELFSTGGTVGTTGVGGLTLGGGLGWLMRKHGLACDNLVSADVVTADGEFIRASEKENPDLFWALRGGGGNFGVVTSFEFGLHPVEPIIGGFAMYPQDRLEDLLYFYREFTSELPNSITTMAGATNGPPGTPLEGQTAGWLAFCHCGDPGEGERLLGRVKEFGEPALGGFGPMSYAAQQAMFEAAGAPGERNYWRSDFLTELPDDAIDTALGYAEDGLRGPGTLLLFEHMGGAIRDVGDQATAFSNRAANHNISLLAAWPNPEDDEENIRWTREFGDAIRQYATGAGYVNYMSGDEGAERVQATYQANLERLREIKRKYDPTNFFNVNQNIAP